MDRRFDLGRGFCSLLVEGREADCRVLMVFGQSQQSISRRGWLISGEGGGDISESRGGTANGQVKKDYIQMR